MSCKTVIRYEGTRPEEMCPRCGLPLNCEFDETGKPIREFCSDYPSICQFNRRLYRENYD